MGKLHIKWSAKEKMKIEKAVIHMTSSDGQRIELPLKIASIHTRSELAEYHPPLYGATSPTIVDTYIEIEGILEREQEVLRAKAPPPQSFDLDWEEAILVGIKKA